MARRGEVDSTGLTRLLLPAFAQFGRRDLDFAGEVESAWAEATAGVGSVAGEATVEVGAVAGDATSWLRRRGPAASAEAKKSERKLGSMAGAATPTTAPAREKRGMVTEYSTEWTTEYSTEWSFGRGADGGHSAGAGAGAGSGKSECDEGTTLYSTHFSTFTQVQGIQTQMAHKSHNSKAHGHKVHQSKAVKTQVATTAAAGATTTSAAVQTTTTSAAAQTTTTATSSSSSSSSDTTSDDLCSQSNVQPAAIASHNDLRAHYGASDLVWNATLVALAQTWADNCVWEDGGGDSVGAGSNIAAISGSGGNTTAQISMWSSEASEYSSSDPEYSHFTQMVSTPPPLPPLPSLPHAASPSIPPSRTWLSLMKCRTQYNQLS